MDISDETVIGIASARLPSASSALQEPLDADGELTYDAFKEPVRVFYSTPQEFPRILYRLPTTTNCSLR